MSRCSNDMKRLDQTPLGSSIRGEFHLESKSIHINHGSYGATPKSVTSIQTHFINHIEQNVERFMKHERVNCINKARQELANFVNAELDALVLVVNATTGINAVLRSLDIQPDHEILCLNLAYPAVLNSLQHVCTQNSACLNIIDVSLPLPSYEYLVDLVSRSITEKTRLAVFDHITSATALLLPVEQLIQVCHAQNIPVLIDGAHAPGQIQSLHLTNLDADFYIGNCHKWLFTSKGCAFLHVASKKYQRIIQPVVTALAYKLGYELEFLHQGTRDESNFMTIPTAIDFYNTIGPKRIYELNSNLIQWASDYLADLWNTDVLLPSSQSAPFMCCIRLPLDWPSQYRTQQPTVEFTWMQMQLICNHIAEIIRDNYQINTKIMAVQEKMYVRISAQIYNEKNDFIALGEAIQCLRNCINFQEKMSKLQV